MRTSAGFYIYILNQEELTMRNDEDFMTIQELVDQLQEFIKQDPTRASHIPMRAHKYGAIPICDLKVHDDTQSIVLD